MYSFGGTSHRAPEMKSAYLVSFNIISLRTWFDWYECLHNIAYLPLVQNTVSSNYSYSRNPMISPLPLEKDSNQYNTLSTPRKMGFKI